MFRRVLFLLATVAVAGCGPKLTTPDATTTTKASRWESVQFNPIEYDALVKEWGENSAACAGRYNGKPAGIKTTGTLTAINVNEAGQTMALVGEKLYVVVVTETGKETLGKFKTGDRLTVYAISTGHTTADPYFNAFKFERP